MTAFEVILGFEDFGTIKNGAREWNRTITVFLPGDFKSPASTNFATRAFLLALSSRGQHILRRNFLKHMRAFKSCLLDFANLSVKEPSKNTFLMSVYKRNTVFCVFRRSSTCVHSRLFPCLCQPHYERGLSKVPFC